jgi:hypothetical protein
VRWIERDDPSVLVAVDAARGGLRGLVGRDVLVQLDAGRAAIELVERDGDGELTLDDVARGGSVRVTGRLVRLDGSEAVVRAGGAVLAA